MEAAARNRIVSLVTVGIVAFAALWLWSEALVVGRGHIRDLFHIWLSLTWPIVVVVSPLVFFSRRRVTWRWWEAAALLLPFTTWLALDHYLHFPKSLANLYELSVILIGVPCAALLRIALARRVRQLPVALVLQLALMAAPAVMYLTTPSLPE